MLELIFRRKTGFFLLIFLMCLSGILLLLQLPILLYPQTSRPRVRVRMNHEGISAIDFADTWSQKIEGALLGAEGVDLLEVSYENDRSTFSMTFDWNTDSEAARGETESIMNNLSASFSQDLKDNYSVGYYSGENAGYLMMGIKSETVSPEELYRMINNSVMPLLSQVKDADTAELYRVEDLTAEINLDYKKMLSYGLSITDVNSAMKTSFRDESVGTLTEERTRYNLRFRRGIDSLYEIGTLMIKESGNSFIRLKDIAEISINYTYPSRTFLMDGKTGIRITATPVDGGNIRQMSEEIQKVLNNSRENGQLPADAEFQKFLDPADYINRSISNVTKSALIGAALAMLIVFLTLGEVLNTLLIGISLPATMIMSFILLYFFDVSLNLISLGGLALAVGMVIDSSIVVMENIHRFRIESPPKDQKSLNKLILMAVKQVREPVIASTLTSILVFIPITMTAPLTNAILGDQAWAVVFALAIAMLVALTLIPAMASVLHRLELKKKKRKNLFEKLMNFYRSIYLFLLKNLIRRKITVWVFIALSAVFLWFSLSRVLPLIPREIISPPSSDRIIIFFKNNQVTDKEQIIKELVPAMDKQIKETLKDQVVLTYADVSSRFSRMFINLKSPEMTDEAIGILQETFVSDNDNYYNIMMWDPAQLPLPRTMDLQINVQGEDPAETVKILEKIRDLVNDTKLYGWAFTRPATNFSDELTMRPRTDIINSFPGVSERSLIDHVKMILKGTSTIEMEEDNRLVEFSAVYPDKDIEGVNTLENFLLPFKGKTVPLKHFFDFSKTTGVAGMASENGEEIFRLYAKMTPGTAASQREIRENTVKTLLKEKLELPSGYSIIFENPQEEMNKAMKSLFLALAISIILIFLLLAFQFNSLVTPLIILVTVPFGFIGVVLSLFLFKSTLSLNSLLGTILLGGIVVNNAIIMIDFYLQIRKDYPDKRDAILSACGIRFTPIMITSFTTIFGMLPLAIGLGDGSNIIQPLGIAVSGGLIISTLFTLFMVPSILSLVRIKS